MIRIRSMIIVFAGAILAAGMSCAEEPDYSPERYEVILDRSPFGSDPLVDTANPEKEAQLAAEAAAKELRLCFLLESQEGEIRAGFQNLKPKPGDPKSITLMVNESFRGMKLLDINVAESEATVEAQGKPVVFKLTKPRKQPAKAPARPGQPATAKTAQAPQPAQRRFGGGFKRTEPPPAPKPEPPKLSPEEEQRRREEVRKNLQEYQMEVIRQGMPPLPIALTPEMDNQLVAEGVLPPIEEEQ